MKRMRYDVKEKTIVYEFDVTQGIASSPKIIAICEDIVCGRTDKEICQKHKMSPCQVFAIKRKFLGKGILIK